MASNGGQKIGTGADLATRVDTPVFYTLGMAK